MREEADQQKIRRLIAELGKRAKGPGRIYLVGGSSIVLMGNGRESTIDVDLKLDPEPAGIFEAIADLKNSLNVNIELAAPDQFIPEVPGWRDRSQFIEVINQVEFYHYDFYSQALAKLERGHDRDLQDVAHLMEQRIVEKTRLLDLFVEIEPGLIRFPSINAISFRQAVESACEPV